MNSGYQLLMLPFCLGAILFYYLFYKSAMIPRALSLWGLAAVSLALIGTVSALAGHELSFVVYLPYLPFEFVVGMWILFRGGRPDWNGATSEGAVPRLHEDAGSDCRTLRSSGHGVEGDSLV